MTAFRKAKSRILDDHFYQPPILIFVLPNGDESGMPVRVRFTSRDTPSFSKLLDIITDRLQLRLRHGSVTKLYTLDGKELTSLDALRDNQFYVAFDRAPLKLPPFAVAEDGTLTRRPTKPMRLTKLPTTVVPSRSQPFSASSHPRAPSPPPSPPLVPPSAPPHRNPPSSSNNGGGSPFLNDRKGSVALIANSGRTTDSLRASLLRGKAGEGAVLKILDELCAQVLASGEDGADILERMSQHLRQRAFEARGSGTEACVAYDDKVEDILTVMMRSDDTPPPSDESLRDRFELAILAAVAGRMAHWELSAMPFVALVVLLDQFPRTIYRGSKDMYMGDAAAAQCVLRAMFKTKVMDEVHPVYRLFPCLALAHQEDMEMQRLCVSEWTRATQHLDADDPMHTYTSIFKANFEAIRRFGRFPDRNKLLGRETTQEEHAYLKEAGTKEISPSKQAPSRLARLRMFGSMAVRE